MSLDLATRPFTEKTWATLRARCALVGLRLHRFENDRGHECFLLERWGLSKTVGSVEAVNVLIARLGGPAP